MFWLLGFAIIVIGLILWLTGVIGLLGFVVLAIIGVLVAAVSHFGGTRRGL
jgi:hypothetical protein